MSTYFMRGTDSAKPYTISIKTYIPEAGETRRVLDPCAVLEPNFARLRNADDEYTDAIYREEAGVYWMATDNLYFTITAPDYDAAKACARGLGEIGIVSGGDGQNLVVHTTVWPARPAAEAGLMKRYGYVGDRPAIVYRCANCSVAILLDPSGRTPCESCGGCGLCCECLPVPELLF